MKKHKTIRREGGALAARKRKGEKWKKALAWAVATYTLGMAPVAFALPVLDAKDAAVRIANVTNGLNITSGAANNVIQWVDFSIGKNESVNFNDTNNYLNYVTGHARSDIFGTLTGDGNIFIINPNGILIGDGATVNVGALYLSTRHLADEQLAAFREHGTNPLLEAGSAIGDVVNLGNLNATSISVEGNVIKFKNEADVTLKADAPAGSKINVNAGGEIRVGFAVGAEATAVNDTQYKKENVTVPTLDNWDFNGKEPTKYMLVRNGYELQNMQNNYWESTGAYYMLANDIALPEVGEKQSNFNHRRDPYVIKSFSGRFDGLNYQIQNLTIYSSKSRDDVGLFGHVSGTGIVENVGLVGGSVTGAGSNVGGIVGENDGIVRNVYHTGRVTGREDVGGIVGLNTGTVERAYNTGDVTGTVEVGGIVGYSKGIIREAFNTGTVLSTDSAGMAGGIVGDNSSTVAFVENAYNTGVVTGAFLVGGIAGKSQGSATNVYNTGTVTGTGTNVRVGGLVGSSDGSLTNAYSKTGVAFLGEGATPWKDYTVSDTIGSTANLMNENVQAVSAEDLKKAATFAGFGFTNGVSSNGKWRMYEGQTMPLLTAFLTRADNRVEKECESEEDVGKFAGYSATTFNGEVEQVLEVEGQYVYGKNYIQDYAVYKLKQSDPVTPDPVPPDPVNPDPNPNPNPNPTPNPNPIPNPAPNPNPNPAPNPQNAIADLEQTQEYKNTVTALESNANAEQEKKVRAMAIPSANGPTVALENRLEILGEGLHMPESMSTEALAASLNGEPTQQTATVPADTPPAPAADSTTAGEASNEEDEE